MKARRARRIISHSPTVPLPVAWGPPPRTDRWCRCTDELMNSWDREATCVKCGRVAFTAGAR